MRTDKLDAKGASMNANTHTPGPWDYELHLPHGSADGVWQVFDPASDNKDVLARVDDEDTRAELGESAEANARLIAAAPELLEFAALVARMKTEDEMGENSPASEDWIATLNELIASARAVVAKAEGRTAGAVAP